VYERERDKDLRPLLQAARDAGLAEAVIGIDLALRDADAHGEFEIVEDGVRFTGTRCEYDFLDDSELIDRVLAGLESACALYCGIAAALPEFGFDHDDLERLSVLKPTPNETLHLILAMNGWREVAVEREAGAIRVSGTRSVPTSIGVAALLLPALEHDAKELILEARDEVGNHVARGPLEPFRRSADATSPAVKHAAILETLATWTIDGKRAIAATTLRKVVALTALEALTPQKANDEALLTLQALFDLMTRLTARGLASQRRDKRLSSAIVSALRLRQQIATDVPIDVDVAALVNDLRRLAPEKVPELRQSW
jgi:hypothetical protein